MTFPNFTTIRLVPVEKNILETLNLSITITFPIKGRRTEVFNNV